MCILSKVKIDSRGLVLISDVIHAAASMMGTFIDTAPDVTSKSCAGGVQFFMDVHNEKQVASFMRVFYEHLLRHRQPVLMLTMFILSVLRGLRIIISQNKSGRSVILPYIACGNSAVQPAMLVQNKYYPCEVVNYTGYDFAFDVPFLDSLELVLLAGLIESYDGPKKIFTTTT